MEINLSDIPIGIAQSEHELKILKSAKMYREIKNYKSDFNFIMVPVAILNIIEHHDYFQHLQLHISNGTKYDEPGIYFVGEFCNLKVYVDLFLHPNQIVLSYDKQVMRDSKIDSILSSLNTNKKDLVINVYG